MSSGVLASYEGTNYINRVPTLMIAFKPKHLPKATPLNTITWEIRTLTCELRWVVGQNIQSTAEREVTLMIIALQPHTWTISLRPCEGSQQSWTGEGRFP